MNLKPVQTIVILAAFLLIGGLAAWFTLKGTATHGPGDMGLDAHGNLYAHFNERVFKFDSAGNGRAVYDLSAIGASGLWGGISVFPDGDWLVVPEGPEFEHRLHRCDPSGELSCQPLAESNLHFDRTFRTAIDGQSRIYLSDQSRHKLSLHDPAGAQISAELSLLQHPGEVKLYGQTLAVADVANFQMKLLTLDAGDGTWLGEIQSFDTSANATNESTINQPVDFIRHQDMWYVLVKDANMSNTRLRRYTLDGDYIDDLPLPDTGMIIAMEKLDNSIVLSDFANERLLRINFAGAPMSDLSSKELELYQQELEGSGTTMRSVGVALGVLFALMVVVGLVVAILLEKRRAQASPSDGDSAKPDQRQSKTAPPSQHDTPITWVGHSNRQDHALMFMGLTVAATTGFALFQPSDCVSQTYGTLMLVFSGILFIMLYGVWRKWKQLSSTRLGVVNEWVVATLPDGSFVRSRAEDLKLARNALLLIENRKVMLGNANNGFAPNGFFERQEFEQYIQPQLQFAQVLDGGELAKWQWQHERTAKVLETLVSIVALVLLLTFYTGGKETFERWFSDTVSACEQSSDTVSATSNENKVSGR